MKKFRLYLVFILMLFIGINNIKAEDELPILGDTNNEVKTLERLESNNYGVNKKFEVNSSNKNIILNTPYVDASLKVYDFASILTEDEEKEIYNYSMEFKKKTGMELIYLTIDMEYTNDSKNEDFAANFYDYNDFGIDLEHYDGILLLRNNYALDKYYDMYTFGSAQLYFNQSRYDDILDSIYYDLTNDNYLEGFRYFKDKCLNYYNVGKPSKYKNSYIDEMGMIRNRFSVPYLLASIISFIVTLFVVIINVRKNKMIKKATEATVYVDKKSINYTEKVDQFINSRTTSYTVSSSSSSGGGSSSHIGSSGGGHSSGGGRHG